MERREEGKEGRREEGMKGGRKRKKKRKFSSVPQEGGHASLGYLFKGIFKSLFILPLLYFTAASATANHPLL